MRFQDDLLQSGEKSKEVQKGKEEHARGKGDPAVGGGGGLHKRKARQHRRNNTPQAQQMVREPDHACQWPVYGRREEEEKREKSGNLGVLGSSGLRLMSDAGGSDAQHGGASRVVELVDVRV